MALLFDIYKIINCTNRKYKMLFLVPESLLAFLKALLQEKILLIYGISVYVCIYV